jgi:hypothetical protein
MIGVSHMPIIYIENKIMDIVDIRGHLSGMLVCRLNRMLFDD